MVSAVELKRRGQIEVKEHSKENEAERTEHEIDRAISIKVTSNQKGIETDEIDDDEEYFTQVNKLGKSK